MTWQVIEGDCLAVLATMDDESIDAVVTDPPYGLGNTSPANVADCLRAWLDGDTYEGRAGFMGATWDGWVPGPEVWREVLRVLKPGGHALVFAGTRTVDLMGIALRLAGFECRDCLQWLYGSGFPKSHNISKAIDRAAGADREVVGVHRRHGGGSKSSPSMAGDLGTAAELPLTAPATEAARKWDGWGSAMKPSNEPILVVRKPFPGSVAANVLKHGTGALNIGACRVGESKDVPASPSPSRGYGTYGAKTGEEDGSNPNVGRWPPNTLLTHLPGCEGDRNGSGCLDGCAVGELGRQSGARDGRPSSYALSGVGVNFGTQGYKRDFIGNSCTTGFDDTGTAARFFPSFRYVAKASTVEREAGLSGEAATAAEITGRREGSAGLVMVDPRNGGDKPNPYSGPTGSPRRCTHPTVKPVDLMRWLVRLVTPPGGKLLDIFGGSGTTGIGAILEGFDVTIIERNPEYAAIARQRIAWWSEHGERAIAAWKARTERETMDAEAGQLGLL